MHPMNDSAHAAKSLSPQRQARQSSFQTGAAGTVRRHSTKSRSGLLLKLAFQGFVGAKANVLSISFCSRLCFGQPQRLRLATWSLAGWPPALPRALEGLRHRFLVQPGCPRCLHAYPGRCDGDGHLVQPRTEREGFRKALSIGDGVIKLTHAQRCLYPARALVWPPGRAPRTWDSS